jgi:hypothetical protein
MKNQDCITINRLAMPLPKPKLDENQNEFMTRCMSDNTMVIEYKRNDQRLAVCYVTWRDRSKK